MNDLTNWAGNVRYNASRVHYPRTVEEVQQIVRKCRKLRVIGSRHSFNSIADSTEDLLSLAGLPPRIDIDESSRSVTVGAAVRYGELCRTLNQRGFAIHNLASLPHISVAGACATATHGSGDKNGNLASAVTALEVVSGGGEIVRFSRSESSGSFNGAVVGLGAAGVVISITLEIIPAFLISQTVYKNLARRLVEDRFADVFSSAYSVSLFTDWSEQSFSQAWVKRLVGNGDGDPHSRQWFGAAAAPNSIHPIESISADCCTEQGGVPGPWHERLPHFRLEFTPSAGDELQSEYLIPRDHAVEAIRAVARIGSEISAVLQVSEVRTVAADQLWMSPCFEANCVAIHFTWRNDWPAVRELLPRLEEQLIPFRARPHWGKLFTMSPQYVQSLYPRLPDFRNLLSNIDPTRKFTNHFVDAYVH